MFVRLVRASHLQRFVTAACIDSPTHKGLWRLSFVRRGRSMQHTRVIAGGKRALLELGFPCNRPSHMTRYKDQLRTCSLSACTSCSVCSGT